MNSSYLNGELNALQNLELKRLEDKPIKINTEKDLDRDGKHFSGLESTLPHSAGLPFTSQNEIITIRKKGSSKTDMRKTKPYYHKESHLSFLKNQKLIPCNLKMGSRHAGKVHLRFKRI